MEVRRSSGEHGVMTAKTSASRIARNPAEIVRRLCKRQCLSNKAFRSKTGCQVPHLPRREGVERGDGEPVLEGIALRTRFTPRRPRTSAPLGIAPIGRLLFGGSHRNALFRGFREFDVFYLSWPIRLNETAFIASS